MGVGDGEGAGEAVLACLRSCKQNTFARTCFHGISFRKGGGGGGEGNNLTVAPPECVLFLLKYSRTSMARTSVEPCKFVRDMVGSSH